MHITNDDYQYILKLLSKKREELISPFLKKDPEWIKNSFKYEKNPAAFDLVRVCFVTLWFDSHIIQIINDGKPEFIRNKAMVLICELMDTPKVDNESYHEILKIKVDAIKAFLKTEDSNIQKLNELKCSYERDKALFERKFSKYEKEMNNKIL